MTSSVDATLPERVEGPARRALRLASFVARRTFVDPVRDGRLKDTGWPRGLAGVVITGVAVYVILMLVAVFGSVARSRFRLIISPPNDTMPALAVPVLCLSLIMAMSLLFTAALHLVWWLRVPLMIIVISSVIYPIDWSDFGIVDAITVGLAAALVIIAVLRWRRGFHWLEFVLGLVIIGHAVALDQAIRQAPYLPYAPNLQLTQLTAIILPLWALALPVAALAGAALVEITTSAVTWTVTGIWRGVEQRGGRLRIVLTVVLVLLVIARGVQTGFAITDPTDPIGLGQLLLAGLIVVAVIMSSSVVTAVADRSEQGDPRQRPDPDDLLPVWGRWAPVLALVVIAPISVPNLLIHIARSVDANAIRDWLVGLDDSLVIDVWAGIATLGLYAVALELARRGRRLAPVLISAFCCLFGASLVVQVVHVVVSTEAILIAFTLAALVVLAVRAVQRRLTVETWIAVAGLFAVSIAYQYRDWFNEPLTQLLGLTGVSAALLVGLLWRILTDNEFARGDSPGLPQPSRVLLAVASAVVGVASAAQVALLGGRADLDLSQVEGLGDRLLGFSLVMAVMFTGLALTARGRDVVPGMEENPAGEGTDHE